MPRPLAIYVKDWIARQHTPLKGINGSTFEPPL
jgi:hypothetical protein